MNPPQTLQYIIKQVEDPKTALSICLASLPKGSQNLEFAELSYKRSLEQSFRSILNEYIGGVAHDMESSDLQLVEFTHGYTPEQHELEFLEIGKVQQVNDLLAQVPTSFTNAPIFDQSERFVKGLKFYVMSLLPSRGPRILFFRRYAAKSALSQSNSLFGATFSKGVFDKITEPTLLFDNKIDCFSCESLLFISQRQSVLNIFGYFDLVEKKAAECLDEIRKVVPMSNFEEFAASCATHKLKLMKLANIAENPYLKKVTIADLKSVISKCKLTGVKIVTNDAGKEELEFDPANRWVILKLLNDDFLESLMTGTDYEVNSKKKV